MVKKKAEPTRSKQELLFELPPPNVAEPELRKPRYPVWTENKALLIQRYLYYFVLVTKHGTYLDCFAGPQDIRNPGLWAAKQVIESRPRWLRQMLFIERDQKKVKLLQELVAAQSPRLKKEPRRTIALLPGNCNEVLPAWLQSGQLRQDDATFCLLDQRTFECEWSTVQAIASYRTKKYKIEQFYFLANSWLVRAIAGTKTKAGKEQIAKWWGRSDWADLRNTTTHDRAEMFCERFRNELGYASAKSWPIYEKQSGGKIMYFMIHATDHPEAPKLMSRAYDRAVLPPEPVEQLSLALFVDAAEAKQI